MMRILYGILIFVLYINVTLSLDRTREQKQFSLFSVVQFPNDDCTSSSSSTTTGTCYASSECASRSGSASGTCAAGFGVCCVISTSTCGSTVSTNNTYIRNPGYPSSYTPTATGTCSVTINKVSNDICQLRLDFQTMSGYTATTAGVCTDKFEATGQTGNNPPAICGTNTGYHMYVEFGTGSSDSIELKTTYGDTSTKQWNIQARQISCTSRWKAPPDCVQYFTALTGTVTSYNFGNQILQSQDYNNCIRQGKGYCRIQWEESSGVTNPFQMDTATGGTPAAAGGMTGTTAIQAAVPCAVVAGAQTAFVTIPEASNNGVSPLNPSLSYLQYQSIWCGRSLSYPSQTTPISVVSARQPFNLGVWTAGAAQASGGTGFSLDYKQLPC